MCNPNVSNLRRSLPWLICLAVLLSACAQPATPALTPITVQLQTTHKAQFAGLYAADQNGHYAAEGLKVTFIEGGTTVDHKAVVASGKARFGLINGDDLISARANSAPNN